MMTDPAASRPGTHLDPDQMADLFEGLLDAAAADGARAHLASCPVCSADFALITGEAELGELSELLPPIPIPQDVVTRVEAALYREPPLAAASGSGSGSAAAAPPTDRSVVAAPQRRRRFRIALGSLAGATLVVAGGIGLITAVSNNVSESKSSSSSGAAAGARPSSPDGDHAPGGESSQAGGVAPNKSGFGEMSISQQAQALLSQHAVTPANGTAQAVKPDCTPSAVPAGTKLLTSTQTQYQGRQAWLLLYPQAGSTTAVDVYVVYVDACTPGIPGQYVDHVVITRP